MKFWKRLMDYIEKISDRSFLTHSNVKDISTTIIDLKSLVIDEYLSSNCIANEEPIKNIKSTPRLLLESDRERKKIIIQNIGTEPCYIKLDNGVSKENYHFILAPDTSPNFGNGGSVTLDNWHGEVYAICEKETKLSVLEY